MIRLKINSNYELKYEFRVLFLSKRFFKASKAFLVSIYIFIYTIIHLDK